MASPLVFVLNGPNLNRLGTRQPEIYGTRTLDEIAEMLDSAARSLGIALDQRQSNHEGHLIDWLHEAEDAGARAVLLNPGGYGHTSVALRDAVEAIATPVLLVHLTDPASREPFRQQDLIAPVAAACFKGEGPGSYLRALDAAARL